MKTRTSELTGSALDWAVAKCEGNIPKDWNASYSNWQAKDYSTDWAQGGPIIEREGITPRYDQRRKVGWEAFHYISSIHALTEACTQELWMFGPTPLVAAMRCYVASMLGDKVDVPEELL